MIYETSALVVLSLLVVYTFAKKKELWKTHEKINLLEPK
jgi:hypothetical protein